MRLTLRREADAKKGLEMSIYEIEIRSSSRGRRAHVRHYYPTVNVFTECGSPASVGALVSEAREAMLRQGSDQDVLEGAVDALGLIMAALSLYEIEAVWDRRVDRHSTRYRQTLSDAAVWTPAISSEIALLLSVSDLWECRPGRGWLLTRLGAEIVRLQSWVNALKAGASGREAEAGA